MQTSRKLIQKYYHVRVGHKLAGIIAQVDSLSLMAARLLGSDFCAVFYRSPVNKSLIPVSVQHGSHVSIRSLDLLEHRWADIDVDRDEPQRGLTPMSPGIEGKTADPFGAANGFASRYLMPIHEEGRLCAVVVAYWFDPQSRVEHEAEMMLELIASVLKAALSMADQLMLVENYSTRLSELLPIFDAPLDDRKFSELVSETICRAEAICPGTTVLLLSRDRRTGRLQLSESFGQTPPAPGLVEYVTRTLEPITEVLPADADGDTHRYRCRDLKRAEELGLTDLVALPIIPGDNVNLVLVVGSFHERGLTANDRELLSVFAVFSQTVLRNALLVKRLRRANRLLEHSSDRLANAETMAALTDMTSGVAHDFNNIFGGIIGRVQLLRLRARDNETVVVELGKIEKLVCEGAETVKRIQEFTTSGRAKDVKAVDLVTVIHDALADTESRWRPLAENKQVVISATYQVDTAVIDGCRDDLVAVIRKLVENAVEHAPEKSTVDVLLEFDDRHYRISVTDRGPGIPPDLAKKVFYPFFTTKSERGAGLGLAIVHGIVSRHSGTVVFDSSPEHGTVFTVTFNRPATITEVTEVTTRRGSTKAGNLHILIADDDEQIRDVLRDMLMINGHRAVACADGFQALETIRREQFDMLITDLGMPGMSGLDLAGAVHELLPQLPIAMITGWGTQLDQREIAAKGIRAVLPKPFHLKDIRALVEDMATV